MVTSQNISSPLIMKIDNRGSKSEECLVFNFKSFIAKHVTVNEQRVNGNWSGNCIPLLRCTLVCFERNSQLKIPFNLINKSRLYNSISTQQSEIKLNMLNAYFVTGFADAESSFVIRIYQDSLTLWAINLTPQVRNVIFIILSNRFKLSLYQKSAMIRLLLSNNIPYLGFKKI